MYYLSVNKLETKINKIKDEAEIEIYLIILIFHHRVFK